MDTFWSELACIRGGIELHDRLALVRYLSCTSLIIVVAEVVPSGAVLGSLLLLARCLADGDQIAARCLILPSQ